MTRYILLLALGLFAAAALVAARESADATHIGWKKTHIDRRFRSEGVAVADVNRDGKPDLLVGDWWYEAPDWKAHEIRPHGDYGDGSNGYSKAMACFAGDFNGDGWPDLLVIGFPGEPCHWYENPRGAPGHWKEHLLWRSACNESPQYADLFKTGRPVLVMGIQPEGQICWFAPGKDPTQPWQPHPISAPGRSTPGTDRFSHGLGVGDVNGDGRPDVLCTAGWWEQPERENGRPWKFHPANLGEPCADMVTYDLTGTGRADVISSSAHRYGIWGYEQLAAGEGRNSFRFHDLFPHLFSESHALRLADINGDGLGDFVTGKRWWAHGPKGDVDPNGPAVLYWFEAVRRDHGIEFRPHEIDHDSGIGTQFTVADVNGDGLLDIAISNKKGVFLFEQVRTPR